MAGVIDIDPKIMRLAHENFWLDLDDVSFGPGLDGREQIVFAENRRWMGQLDFLRMDFSAHMEARVIGDRLRGRANRLRICVCNRGTARYLGDTQKFYEAVDVPYQNIAQGGVFYDDGASFDDGAGFALPDIGEPTIISNAAAGISVVQMDGYLGRNIAVGAFFSINDFLYRVESNTDGAVIFNPPLRHGVAAGTRVDVTRPKVQVRLRDKADWRPFCEYFRNGRPMTVSVVEAFDR